LLVSFYGKMQVYGIVMSLCANAGLWYCNVRMCQCRFMVLYHPYVPMQVYGTVMSVCANAGLWYRNVRMCHCINTPENSSHHFPWRLHCFELLFDWRMRMISGHRVSLAVCGVVEEPSLIFCNIYA
jgi:hypothetical protein